MSELQQIVDILNEQNRANAKFHADIRRRFAALKPVVEIVHQRLSTIEEGQEIIARDAAQSRESGHKIRNALAALCVATETLLEIAEGKSRSSDTIAAVHADLRKAIDGQR